MNMSMAGHPPPHTHPPTWLTRFSLTSQVTARAGGGGSGQRRGRPHDACLFHFAPGLGVLGQGDALALRRLHGHHVRRDLGPELELLDVVEHLQQMGLDGRCRTEAAAVGQRQQRPPPSLHTADPWA